MPYKKFRKLNIDLPTQPLVDERPWLAAGLLLGFIILLISAYAYFDHIKQGTSPAAQKKIVLRGLQKRTLFVK